MYNKFKNCLIKPSKIYQYVDEKFGKALIYFLLLTLIYVLPNIVSITSFKKLDNTMLTTITNSFEKSETINYQIQKIEDEMVLVSTMNNPTPQSVRLENFMNGYDLVLLFSLEKEELTRYNIDNSLVGKSAFYLLFQQDGVELFFAQYYGNPPLGNGGIQKLSSAQSYTSPQKSLVKKSYEKLGVTEMNFAISRQNSIVFSREINHFIMSIYQHHKVAILFVAIPSIYIVGAIQFLLDALILTLLVKLLYSQYGLKFGKIFKIIVLTYTPRVIFNILSIFWSNMFMYIFGEIISVVYLLIAMKYYSINQKFENRE